MGSVFEELRSREELLLKRCMPPGRICFCHGRLGFTIFAVSDDLKELNSVRMGLFRFMTDVDDMQVLVNVGQFGARACCEADRVMRVIDQSYLQGKPGNQDTVMITLPFVS